MSSNQNDSSHKYRQSFEQMNLRQKDFAEGPNIQSSSSDDDFSFDPNKNNLKDKPRESTKQQYNPFSRIDSNHQPFVKKESYLGGHVNQPYQRGRNNDRGFMLGRFDRGKSDERSQFNQDPPLHRYFNETQNQNQGLERKFANLSIDSQNNRALFNPMRRPLPNFLNKKDQN